MTCLVLKSELAVPAVMSEALDDSFRYPKPAYLAAISAQVCPAIRSRRDPCKPQRFTAAWASGLRSDVIRVRSRQLSDRQHFLHLKFGAGQASPQGDDYASLG